MKRDPSGNGGENGQIDFDRKSWRKSHFHEIAQLLEMLELGSNNLEKQKHIHINEALKVGWQLSENLCDLHCKNRYKLSIYNHTSLTGVRLPRQTR